jgi:ABC-type methionine transport system ATPase subunit
VGVYLKVRAGEGRVYEMAKVRVKFTFPAEQIREPIIWEVGKRFDLMTNIRRADVTSEIAWAVLELDGEKQDLEQGLKWVEERGVRVDPIEDSIIEG